jgi:hypothetical protein
MCVLGGGSWYDVAFSRYLAYLDFFLIDGLARFFFGYHVDSCSYSLVFWEF